MPRITRGEHVLKRLDAQGRITLPAEVKRLLKVSTDDYVTFEIKDDKSVVIRKATVTVH
jgi:bifunctional DNA-binding transcriptional regulator/antitoxin component of YhaV-PrlF toxin-antitoxin module